MTQFSTLKALAEMIDLSKVNDNSWELRLYSRDSRLSTMQAFKVLLPSTPRAPDELELRIGDYVYIKPDAMLNSCDELIEGISWLTGNKGFFPKNHIVRVCEVEAWTLHISLPLTENSSYNKNEVLRETDELAGKLKEATIICNTFHLRESENGKVN